MLRKTARVSTSNAKRYVPRLCRHFSHKVPVNWGESRGDVEFPMGNCHMDASETVLRIQCESDSDESLERVCGIVATHLVRFAERARNGEELNVVWSSE